jgi:dienelactone hydrolase
MPVSSQPLRYRDGATVLTGALYRDDAADGPRPGLLLAHGGAGLDDHAREQALRWARAGHTVLACDLFGPGVAGDRARVVGTLTALRDDPDALVSRVRAGLDALLACPHTAGRAAAIGYCFGGLAVLTLLRAGVDLAGVVSVHGSLSTPRPAMPGTVRAPVLVCHGAADPHVPPADVSAFATEMTAAGADWQLVVYGGAPHGFTHRTAVPGATPGVAYDEDADHRSFAAARRFLAEAFGGREGAASAAR